MFYDFLVDIINIGTSDVNEVGETIYTYTLGDAILCDIQPSTRHMIESTFGKDIESSYTMFCDENLDVGTYVKFDDNIYQINSKIDWIDYKLYSLKGCDIYVN